MSTAGEGDASVEEITLTVRWSGKDFTVRVCGDDTVGELKRRICEATTVLPKRQKLLNLKAAGAGSSKGPDDSTLVSQLVMKPNMKIMMMGTVEDEIMVEAVEAGDVVDDFEIGEEESLAIHARPENKLKLRRRSAQFKWSKLLGAPRPGKKLLVLDIDYTLFDHVSSAESPLELMRPYLHEFLAASYSAYDIIIWSATGMKWVEVKMRELGVLGNPNYHILALMDHLAMITVQSQSHGVFDCKPLQIIWDKFPEHYHAGNTIMFDDLRRNFVMNPANGITIRPYRHAYANRDKDRELAKLTDYLLAIADLDDWSHLDHSQWERYLRKLKH